MRMKSINGCWCYTLQNQDILMVVKTTRRPVRNTLISSSMQHNFSLTSQTRQSVNFLKKWKMEKFKRNWLNNHFFHMRLRETFKLRKVCVYVMYMKDSTLTSWSLKASPRAFTVFLVAIKISCIPLLCTYVIVLLYYL